MKYLKRIYNNIKYILFNDLNKVNNNYDFLINELTKLVDDNYDKLDDRYYSLDNSIEDIMREMYDKLDYDGVVDCIFDNPDNDIREDVKQLKVLCDVLTKNNDLLMQNKESNNNIEVLDYERDLLINEVIKTIIDRLKVNENV